MIGRVIRQPGDLLTLARVCVFVAGWNLFASWFAAFHDMWTMAFATALAALAAAIMAKLNYREYHAAVRRAAVRRWQDIPAHEAADLDLSVRLDITAPCNEKGERCPWPWEPEQMGGLAVEQYSCSYCGATVLAGMRHIDYAGVRRA